MFSQSGGSKRQKVVKDRHNDVSEKFAGINKIEYKGENASYDDTLCYRYYNANEKIHGRTMEDWLKPAISLTPLKFNGIDSSGKPLFEYNCEGNSTEDYKRFIYTAFEFCFKLGIKRWVASIKDLMPENENVEEHNIFINEIAETINEAQLKYSLKPLWITPSFFSAQRNSIGLCSDAHNMTYAGYQMKKCIELCQKVGSDSFAMINTDEGCNKNAILDVGKELKHFAKLLKMGADYKEKMGYRGQLLINTTRVFDDAYNRNHSNPKECFRSRSSINPLSELSFLKHYNMDRFYKLITNPDYFHQCMEYNAMGSLEIDCDDLITLRAVTLLFKGIIDQGGLHSGGINIQPYSFKGFSDVKDMFIVYIKHIDNMARGLRIAAKMITDQAFMKKWQQKYQSFYNGFGSRISNGEATLEECEEQIRKQSHHLIDNINAFRYEHWLVTFENFLNIHHMS